MANNYQDAPSFVADTLDEIVAALDFEICQQSRRAFVLMHADVWSSRLAGYKSAAVFLHESYVTVKFGNRTEMAGAFEPDFPSALDSAHIRALNSFGPMMRTATRDVENGEMLLVVVMPDTAHAHRDLTEYVNAKQYDEGVKSIRWGGCILVG